VTRNNRLRLLCNGQKASLYLPYTADLPVAPDTITATYADDILAAHKENIEASQRLQESLFHLQIWLKKWRIRVNGAKSVQADFHHPQKDVSASDLERPEDPSSRERELFGTTCRS